MLSGTLRKMQVTLQSNGRVHYTMVTANQALSLNELIGKRLQLIAQGRIECIHCGRKTKKSFNQGYCYPCFMKLAQCDVCIMKPELCHYDKGTCRESAWGEQFCMTDHIIYLANSSGIKVGITRATQVPTRWIDQGAVQALPIIRVNTRKLSGIVEDLLRQKMADRTNWRGMLKGQIPAVDLTLARDRLFSDFSDKLSLLQSDYGLQAISLLHNAEILNIDYPVEQYPEKVVSFNLDKTSVVEGILQGIKGQYLIFDLGVINVRKYAGYDVLFDVIEKN